MYIMEERDHILWVEKYRPKTIDDCILPPSLKGIFNGIVKSGDIPHLLLAGPAGVGKTTVARALCNELDATYIVINASDDRNIDTLRVTVKQFASAISFDGKRRVVILDEADYLNPQTFQPALRGVMEEFSKNCSFILTCNYKNKLIDPIHSRCAVKDFRITKDDRKGIIESIYKRVVKILEAENVEYDGKVLANLVVKHFPDFRRILNELQSFSKINGRIDEGILAASGELNFSKLYVALKDKNFNDVRAWAADNSDNDPSRVYRKLYEGLRDQLEPKSLPQSILILADYEFKSAFSVDPEINLLACLIQIMVECRFA
jgi:replication-associated recombination protein RarA